MQRFERFVVLVYNEGCGAAGVNEARLHLFISETKLLQSIPSTQVSDTTIGLLTASSLTGATGNPRCQGMVLTQGQHVYMATAVDHAKACTERLQSFSVR